MDIYKEHIEKAWSCIIPKYIQKCKEKKDMEGFNLFLLKSSVCIKKLDDKFVKYNCCYRFITKGSYFWNTLPDLWDTLESKVKENVYIIAIIIDIGDRDDSIFLIKIFDDDSDKELFSSSFIYN